MTRQHITGRSPKSGAKVEKSSLTFMFVDTQLSLTVEYRGYKKLTDSFRVRFQCSKVCLSSLKLCRSSLNMKVSCDVSDLMLYHSISTSIWIISKFQIVHSRVINMSHLHVNSLSNRFRSEGGVLVVSI